MENADSKRTTASRGFLPYASIAVLAILLVTVLAAGYLISERRAALRDGYLIAQQSAGFSALATEGTLDSARQLLRSMAVIAGEAKREGGKAAPAVRRTLLDWQRADPYLMDLLILDSAGRIIHWTGPGTPPPVDDRPYFRVHAENNRSGLHLGRPLLSKVHQGQWFCALSEAIRAEDGKLNYVVVAIIDVRLLRDRLHVGAAVPGTTQALLSEDGVVYVRTPEHEKYVGKSVSRVAELAMLSDLVPSTTIETVSQLDGRARILAFQKIRGFPLVAAGTIETDAVYRSWWRYAFAGTLLWLVIVIGIVWIVLRLHRERKVLAELASIDSLTGTLNRRSILDTATNLERSQSFAGALSLLMIDADHFKSINDRFGHAVGDDVLRRLSEVLRRNVRTNDIVGRYGGEEFLVLMPDTGEPGALRVAEKLRAAVEAQITRPVPLTISVGVATTREGALSLDRTLAHADAALYAAKAAGRNCVRADGDHTAS
ncbi:MAG TPA: sensor domain-containing diguanylate cyclase [Rhodocyclaceae bacterium]